MKRTIILISILLSFSMWECSKVDTDFSELSLKESLEKNVAEINDAVVKISGSKGFQLISSAGEDIKSDYTFRDSITLKLIAGIYDYQPDSVLRHNNFFPYKLFRKSAPGSQLIVNLPEKLVYHPKNLHFFTRSNLNLNNNFKITASDYHFYYNTWFNFNYKLVAGFTLNSKDIGGLDIISSARPGTGSENTTRFGFPEGYSLIKSAHTGDTTGSSFALMKDDETLLEEEILYTGEGFKRKERHYTLSIGNIDIKRTPGIDSIQVFLNGVLQKNAAARFNESDDYNGSICNSRDILLTFDDGTQARLSELIEPAHATLKTLVKSLGEMYLSKQIIDFIALSIYFNSR